MPGVQNWNTSPLHFIDQNFSYHNEELAGAQLTSERMKQLFDNVSNYFQDKFQPEKWPEIPSLNDVPIEELYDGQVVRFRGMIQVHFFFKNLSVLKSGFFCCACGFYLVL